MALRMQVYVGLLYQDLIKRGEFAEAVRLPPILPVVVYNGRTPWTASDELRALVAAGPDELTAFQASQRYLLIDQNRIDPAELADAVNVAALLFNCELCPRLGIQLHVSQTLLAWLRCEEQAALRRSIDAWFKRLQLRETGHVFIEGVEQLLEGKVMGEGEEPRLGRWAAYFVNEGRQQGLAEGKTMALREVLKRQMQRRFGSIPAPMVAVVDHADMQTLERWADRVWDASNVDAVFSD